MKHPSIRLRVTRLRCPTALVLLLALLVVATLVAGVPSTAMAEAAQASAERSTNLFAQDRDQVSAPPSEPTTTEAYVAILPLVLKNTGAHRPFGVQLFAVNSGVVARVGDVGAGWVRVPFYWDQVEPVNTTPEYYQWPLGFEAQLADLASRNIEVILTLGGNPSWAATYAGGPIDKVDLSEMAQFLAAAVARYGQPPFNVKHWEFYNEPDNGDEFYGERGYGFFGTKPGAYVNTLKAVYGPMKAADPEVQIVFGGIAYDNWIDNLPPGPFIPTFLDKVLEAGGGAYFDVMNFHYYPDFREVWEPYGNGIIGKATYLRRKLATYGLDKPFICTEAGYWSDAAHGGSDETQSRYVVQVLTRSMAARLKALTWFWFLDEVHLGSRKYGLLNPDLSPKPAYFAFNTFSRKMAMVDYQQAFQPGAVGASEQIEGYEFVERFGTRHILVAWTNDGLSHGLSLETAKVNITEKLGGETTVLDGDDGVADGRVSVTIGPSPVYLTFEP